eukprot:Opistho-2@85752
MADLQAERKLRDNQARISLNQKLAESGERERLKELLHQRLTESGWRDELKAYCKEVVKSKGLERVTVEDLIAEVTPRARATVPDEIKAELLARIKEYVSQVA